MKPSVNKILTKLSKDKELEKVELAMIDDLKASSKRLGNDVANLIEQKRRLQDEVKRLKQSFINHDKIFIKAFNMAEELGVEIDNFYYRQREDAQAVLREYSKIQ